MDFQCEIERFTTYPTAYTEKQRDHLLGKIKLSSKEYFNEVFNEDSDLLYPVERKQFSVQKYHLRNLKTGVKQQKNWK